MKSFYNPNNTLYPYNDAIFKRLFGSSKSTYILKDFLQAILNIEIINIELDLNKEIIGKRASNKDNLLDIRAKINNNIQINIEMQNFINTNFEARCLEYWANLYTHFIQKGDDYAILNKTICIWILNEDYFKNLKEYHTIWKMSDIFSNTKCFDNIELHIIELNKF